MPASFWPKESAIALLCCAYILGLLVSGLPLGNLLVAGLGLTVAWVRSPAARQFLQRQKIALPQAWWRGPPSRWWAVASLVSLLAAGYLQISLPYAASNDISRLVPSAQTSVRAEVTGTIQSRPALTRRGTAQLWLTARQARGARGNPQTVSGNVFATVPRKAARELHPGQTVTIAGSLYRPQRATRPHGFDFATYLSREGAFAGLKGATVRVDREGGAWGGWAIRARIVRSLQKGTDARTGALIGALVLGKDAADVPYDLKDSFIQSGLAHALAASGFQVSLILSVVLGVGRSRLSTGWLVAVGSGALLLYGFLSGADPSIVRAIALGCASLVALLLERQIRPIPALAVIAVLMLLFKPFWIWDLGFQLSFLATLGLLASASPLAAALDWLPPTIASAIAVPLAATLWTLPLQLYVFGVLPLYGLMANVMSALLLSLLTVGGFASSLAALVWPQFGSGLAWVLYWPAQLQIAIVRGIGQLPGHSLALGRISLLQLLALYGCIVAVWLVPQSRKYWRLAAAIGLLLVAVPVWQVQTQRFSVTVFDQTQTPMMAIQHPQGTVVMNSGDRLNASQFLVPFLQQEGINRIDWAIDTVDTPSDRSGWVSLLRKIPIQVLSRCIPQAATEEPQKLRPQRQIEVNPHERLTLGHIEMVLWRARPTTLELQIGPQKWLLVDGSTEADFAAWLTTVRLPSIQVLWWRGAPISLQILAQLKPQTLILSGQRMNPAAISAEAVPKVFWTERDGTIQWTPQQGFSGTINPGENNLSPLG
ncbi:ComEC/Rec2 family competence protein [Altericista sp. CCNU0014]|uniref:ComEC/Rec2 family competence protein n=1 Tax=Altericista sp. CCNU0014 TaxID=3082949 RepID=UPI0038505361